MTAAEALATIERTGVRVRADGARLVLRPAALVTADTLALARAHKAALLAMLRPTVDPLPAGARDILGLVDLGDMSTDELVTGLGWPHGPVIGLLRRLRDLGVIRVSAGRWALTPAADRYAVTERRA